MIDRLWAGWRIPYIEQHDDQRTGPRSPALSLFEAIEQSGLPDAETYVLWRGERSDTTSRQLTSRWPVRPSITHSA